MQTICKKKSKFLEKCKKKIISPLRVRWLKICPSRACVRIMYFGDTCNSKKIGIYLHMSDNCSTFARRFLDINRQTHKS